MDALIRKWLAGLLAVLYFTTNVALVSAAEVNIWSERKKVQLASLPASFQPLNQLPSPRVSFDSNPKWKSQTPRIKELLAKIPNTNVRIHEVYEAASPKNDFAAPSPVLVVQDVHLNQEAQGHIASVLQELIHHDQVGLIGVEGAFAPFDFEPFRAYEDKAITRTVTQTYFDQKRLSAPSFVGVTSPVAPPSFIGIDDKKHYEANVKAYLDSTEDNVAILKELAEEERQLTVAKSSTFSAQLKRFDDLRSSHHASQIGFGSYLQSLQSFGENSSLVIDQFLEAYGMESKLDFERVEVERRRILTQLAERLSEKDLSELVAQSVAYRTGEMSFGAYYANIERLCEKSGTLLRSVPTFEAYIRYALLSEGISAERLFKAVEVWEGEIVEALARTSAEKRLLAESEHLSLTRKMLDFALTPIEWGAYGKMSVGKTSLKSFEEFYRLADIRSDKMVENLLSKVPLPVRGGARGGDDKRFGSLPPPWPSSPLRGRELTARFLPSVLVVGGFHTPRITDHLRKQRISYVVVSPKVTKIEEGSGSEYLSVFAREKTPLDKLFSGEKLFLSPPTHLQAGTPVRAAFSADLVRAQGGLAIKKASIESLLQFIVSSRRKEYRDSMRLFVSQMDPSVEFVQLEGPLDLVYRRMGYAFSEILKNAIILGSEYKNSKSRIDEKFLRERLAALHVSFNREPDGTVLISVENSGAIDPKAFSTEKLKDLKKLLEHLWYLTNNNESSDVSAPHLELAHFRLGDEVEELASDILNHLQASIALVGRMIEKSESLGLTVDDAKELIFAPFVTTKLDLFKSRYFDWEEKPELEVDDFFGGRGIGMASAKRFLVSSGIKVDIESDNEKTRFVIRVPKELVKADSLPSGGMMIWLRNLVLPQLQEISPKFNVVSYHLGVGPFLEHVLSLSAGALIGWFKFDAGGNIQLALLFAALTTWSVFVVLHLVDLSISENRAEAKENLLYVSAIAGAGMVLGGVTVHWPVLFVFIQTLGLFFYHNLINHLIAKLRMSEGQLAAMDAIQSGFPIVFISAASDLGLALRLPRHRQKLAESLLAKMAEFVHAPLSEAYTKSLTLPPLILALFPGKLLLLFPFVQVINQQKVNHPGPLINELPLLGELMELGYYFEIHRETNSWPPSLALSYFRIVEIVRDKSGNPHKIKVERLNGAFGATPVRGVKDRISVEELSVSSLVPLQSAPFRVRAPNWKKWLIVMPILETLVFQNFGYSVFLSDILGRGLSLSWDVWIGLVFLALVFAGVHFFVKIMGRIHENDVVPPIEFVAHTGLFFIFTLPFLFLNSIWTATLGAIFIHSAYNYLVLQRWWIFKHLPLASTVPPDFSALKGLIFFVGPKVAVIKFELLEGLKSVNGEQLLWNRDTEITPERFHRLLEYLRKKGQQNGGDNFQRLYQQLLLNDEAAQKARRELSAFLQKGTQSLLVTDKGILESPERTLSALSLGAWRGIEQSPYYPVATYAIALAEGQYPIFEKFVETQIPKSNLALYSAMFLQPFAFPYKFSDKQIHEIKAALEFLRYYQPGLASSFLYTASIFFQTPEVGAHITPEMLRYLADSKRAKQPLFKLAFEILFRHLTPESHKIFRVSCQEFLAKFGPVLARQGRLDEFAMAFAAADKKMQETHKAWIEALGLGEDALVMPTTREQGERLGLSEKEIREQYAPVVESLTILNPIAFWKAHDDKENGLNRFAQAKRKQGIVLVWAVMIFVASLPLGLIPPMFQFVLHVDMPLWLFVAAPLLSASFSIGWGVGLLAFGHSQRFIRSDTPYSVPLEPLFLPFFPAFYGSYLAHRWWNKKHPKAAMVNGQDDGDTDNNGFTIGSGLTAIFAYNGVEDSFPFTLVVNGAAWNVDIDETEDNAFVLRPLEGQGRTIRVAAADHQDFIETIFGVQIKIIPDRGLIGIANASGDKIYLQPHGLFSLTIIPPSITVHQNDRREKKPNLAESQIAVESVRMEAQFRIGFAQTADEKQKIKAVDRLRRQMKALFRKGAPRELLLEFLTKLNESVLVDSPYRLVPDPNAFAGKYRLFELGKIARREQFSLKGGSLPIVLVKIISRDNPQEFHGHNHLGREAVFVLDVFEEVARSLGDLARWPMPPVYAFQSEIHRLIYSATHAFGSRFWLEMGKDNDRVIRAIVEGHAAHFSEHEERRLLGTKKNDVSHEGREEHLALLRSVRDANPFFEFMNILGMISEGANHLPVLFAFLEIEKGQVELETLFREIAGWAEKPESELRAHAARAYDLLEKEWLLEHGFSDGKPSLVLPSTMSSGRARGLTDEQIRKEYAHLVEALDVLNPWRFWKAHAVLNDGGKWMRLRGIAQIWLAMIWTSVLPGVIVSLGALIAGLVLHSQAPTWLYWAPPVITLVGSLGWGYVLYFSGYSQKLLEAKNPLDIVHSWIFLPFRFAFHGNSTEHRWWNVEHPSAALVRNSPQDKSITAKSVWQMISLDRLAKTKATEGRLTIDILEANFAASDKQDALRKALGQLVSDGDLRIVRVEGRLTYYGFGDASRPKVSSSRLPRRSQGKKKTEGLPAASTEFKVGQRVWHTGSKEGRVVRVSPTEIIIQYGKEGDWNFSSMPLTKVQAQTAIEVGRLSLLPNTEESPSTQVEDAAAIELRLSRRFERKNVELIKAAVSSEEWAALLQNPVSLNAILLSFEEKSPPKIEELKELLKFIGPVKYATLTGAFSGITPSMRRALNNLKATNETVGKARVVSMKEIFAKKTELADWFTEWKNQIMNGDTTEVADLTKRLSNELAFLELVKINREDAAKVKPSAVPDMNSLALRQRVSNLLKLMGDPARIHRVLDEVNLNMKQKQKFWWWLIEMGLHHLSAEWFERFVQEGVQELKAKNREKSTDNWLRPMRLIIEAIFGAAPLLFFVILQGAIAVDVRAGSVSMAPAAVSIQESSVDRRHEAVVALLGNTPVQKYFGEFRGYVGTVDEIEQPSFVSWVNSEEQGEELIRSVLKNPKARLVLGVDRQNEDLTKKLADSPFVREGRLALVTGSSQMSALDLIHQAKTTDVYRDKPDVRLSLMVLDGVELPSNFFQLSSSEWKRFHAEAVVYFVNQAFQAVELPLSVLMNWTAFLASLTHA